MNKGLIFKNIDYFTFFQDIEIDGVMFDLHNDFFIGDYCFINNTFILTLKHHCKTCNDLIIVFRNARMLKSGEVDLRGLSISDIFRQQWVEQIDYSEQKDEMLIEILLEGQDISLVLTCSEYEITNSPQRDMQ
ncbi:hypothetical protein [Helicobacter brantae]|uniref:Uncharacterized protein n=1 Tax=Helicobacter brantae TaxID=375927 RepID=A0A3D8J2L0_9HELI|nr:hypothetical protein [Helicobacter brantae]RDU71094.1 hypothetical protein CQA58_02990 [Helicobacter brantae]